VCVKKGGSAREPIPLREKANSEKLDEGAPKKDFKRCKIARTGRDDVEGATKDLILARQEWACPQTKKKELFKEENIKRPKPRRSVGLCLTAIADLSERHGATDVSGHRDGNGAQKRQSRLIMRHLTKKSVIESRNLSLRRGSRRISKGI